MTKFRYIIPNTITLGNLFFGILSIYFTAFQGDLSAAAWCVVIAAIFDFFDGLVARLLHAQSAIGADLDSLSDVVSFGVAPAFMLFYYLLDVTEGLVYALPSLLVALFSALRLAKFNNDSRVASHFFGLPVPANALLHIGLVHTLVLGGSLSLWALLLLVYAVVLASCFYMLSDFPLLAFKIHFPIKERTDRVLLWLALSLLVLGILCVTLLGWSGLLPFMLCYIFLSALCYGSPLKNIL